MYSYCTALYRAICTLFLVFAIGIAIISLGSEPIFAASMPSSAQLVQTSAPTIIVAAAPTIVATAPATAATTPAATTDSNNIAADKLDSFAKTYLQVLQLLSDREPELPAAETSAEAVKIQESIEQEAIALITKSGLTMPEYMEILGLASQDTTFRDKVLSRMDESLAD